MIVLLNATYQPIAVIDWKKAVNYIVKELVIPATDKIEKVVRGVNKTIKVPKMLALKKYIKIPMFVKWTPNRVKIRDRYTCGYCLKNLKDLPRSKFTIDHIIPISKGGGKKCFLNTVCACLSCNLKKSDKLLEHTDMKLLTKVYHPSFTQYMELQLENYEHTKFKK